MCREIVVPETSKKVFIDSGVLLGWDQIKLAGRFFVEERAFFPISAAPMLVSSWNT